MNWKLVTLAFSMALASVGTSIPNVALPTLAREFSASFGETQWVVLSYLLATTLLVVSIGRLGDNLGRGPAFRAGILLYSFGALACAAAPSLSVLIAARAIQGLGAAALMALSMALISESVPRKRSGSAIGLLGTMSAVGTALGPSLGGILISTLGWRSVFLAMSALGALSFVLARRFLPLAAVASNKARRKLDGRGALLLAGGLAAYALALTSGDRPIRAKLVLLAISIVVGALFLSAEARAEEPLVDPAKLRSPELAANLAMNATVSTVMMSTLIVGPFYLSRGLHLEAAQVGLVMSTGPILSAITGIPAGRLVDRAGASAVILLGLLQMLVGVIALSVLPARLGLGGFMVSTAILSPGYQLFQAANGTWVMSRAGASERGVVSGLLSLSRNLGLITGASLMGTVFAGFGMRNTFCFAAVLIAFAILLARGTRLKAMSPEFPKDGSPAASRS